MTASLKSRFLQTLSERGFIHQCTDLEALDSVLSDGEKSQKPVAAYIGFDCTAPSLHVGSLMQIMVLRWLQKCGHKPIVLMGGGTTKVGDPSGKDESRKLLRDEDIANNMAGIKSVFSQYITFGEGDKNAVMVNNDEWLSKEYYIDFLRNYGRLFSVNRMLSMDSVKLRLDREQHLSFLEFNYMVLQAYDFLRLRQDHNCVLQIGGSDQWGNIIMGVEIWKKANTSGIDVIKHKGAYHYVHSDTPNDKWKWEEIHGLTTPLLTTSSGAKMGKTADGAVWLNADMYSPYQFWQYWRNTEDADVRRFLLLFTELEIVEIDRLMQGNINDAKKVLANEVTRLCHGDKAAADAAETARKTFEEGAAGEGLPEVQVSKAELEQGIPAFKLFHMAGLAESGGEAKKLIQGGGGKINDEKLIDPTQLVTAASLAPEGYIKLSAGKKRHAKIII